MSFLKNRLIEHIALSLILWYQERMLCNGRSEETEKTYIIKKQGCFLKKCLSFFIMDRCFFKNELSSFISRLSIIRMV